MENMIERIRKSPKYRKELRCVHRHTIADHPSCFVQGRIKWPNDRVFERFTGEKWFNFPGYKIGYFDIETDSLVADFGTVLSWAWKLKGGETKTSVITKKEIFNGDLDRRLIAEFIEEMKNYKIIVGYYSKNFDLPYMLAKALHYGMEFPEYGEHYHWDMYFTVKSKMKISRKSLDNACDYLGIEGKTPIDKDVWRRAKYGDPKALDEVLVHNIADVEILEELHNKLAFSRKWIRTSI